MPLTATVLPSSTRTVPLAFNLSQLALHHDWFLVTGIHVGGAPATFGDLSDTETFTPEQYVSYSELYGVGGMVASGSIEIATLTGQGGRDLWVCVFNASPSSLDIPIATAGPFTVTSY